MWELYKTQNLQHYHTEVVSVLPVLVFGPGATIHGGTSETMISGIMNGQLPGVFSPDIQFSVVDVRDAAEGHCLALFKPSIDGQRISLSGGIMYHG